MWGNCEEKMPVISSKANEWLQTNQRLADEKSFNNMTMAPSSSSSRSIGLMEKHPQQQQPLKCPRCDSSNTKFCYYNNYSLSQPRHFCKACKRYWTRGGTLRNVPVGGGCRKNKRVKRPTSNATASSSSSIDGSSNSSTTSSSTNPNPQISHFSAPSASNNFMSPLFYGLSNMGYNLPLIPSRFSNSKVSSSGLDTDFISAVYGGLGALGVGFPPLGDQIDDFNNPIATTDKPLFSGCRDPIFGSLSSSSTPSVPALLASSNTLHQQKRNNGGDISRSTQIIGPNYLQTLASFQGLQVGDHEAAIAMNKEAKVDHDQEKKNINQMAGHFGFTDPSVYSNWTSSGVGAWLDPTNNIGSSLTSLI